MLVMVLIFCLILLLLFSCSFSFCKTVTAFCLPAFFLSVFLSSILCLPSSMSSLCLLNQLQLSSCWFLAEAGGGGLAWRPLGSTERASKLNWPVVVVWWGQAQKSRRKACLNLKKVHTKCSAVKAILGRRSCCVCCVLCRWITADRSATRQQQQQQQQLIEPASSLSLSLHIFLPLTARQSLAKRLCSVQFSSKRRRLRRPNFVGQRHQQQQQL